MPMCLKGKKGQRDIRKQVAFAQRWPLWGNNICPQVLIRRRKQPWKDLKVEYFNQKEGQVQNGKWEWTWCIFGIKTKLRHWRKLNEEKNVTTWGHEISTLDLVTGHSNKYRVEHFQSSWKGHPHCDKDDHLCLRSSNIRFTEVPSSWVWSTILHAPSILCLLILESHSPPPPPLP